MITPSLVLYCQVFHPKVKDLIADGVIKPYEVHELMSQVYPPRHSEETERQRSYTVNPGFRNGQGPIPPYKEEKYTQLILEL